jgi:hypothetical protein
MAFLYCSALTVIPLKQYIYFRTRASPKIHALRAEVFIFGCFFNVKFTVVVGSGKKMKRGNSIRVNSPWYVITVPSPSDSTLLSYSGFSVKGPMLSEILFSVLFCRVDEGELSLGEFTKLYAEKNLATFILLCRSAYFRLPPLCNNRNSMVSNS